MNYTRISIYLRFHLLDLVLGMAVVAVLLAGALVGVSLLLQLVLHAVAVHVLAAGPALEVLAQRLGPPPDHAPPAAIVAALRHRRRRDLVIQERLMVVELLVIAVQQVWLQIWQGDERAYL